MNHNPKQKYKEIKLHFKLEAQMFQPVSNISIIPATHSQLCEHTVLHMVPLLKHITKLISFSCRIVMQIINNKY